MKIVLNGKDEIIEKKISFLELIDIKAIPKEGLVLVVNDDVITADRWDSLFIEEGMSVELLNFVSAG